MTKNMFKLKINPKFFFFFFLQISIFNSKAVAAIFVITGHGFLPRLPTTYSKLTIDPNLVVFSFHCNWNDGEMTAILWFLVIAAI